jgi:ABC-type branched-subunit amino acid transport system permease subunit
VRARGKLLPPLLAIALLAAAWLALGMLVTNSYYLLMLTLVPIWAVLGLSWNLLSGYTGLLSFGHAAFFGLGAYTVTIALTGYDLTPWLGIPLGMLLGAIAAIVIGYPTFRLRGHYFALSMLAYPMALLYVFEWLGYQEVPLPMKRQAPGFYMQFSDYRVYVALAVALLVAALLVSLLIERSRFGMSLVANRTSRRPRPRASTRCRGRCARSCSAARSPRPRAASMPWCSWSSRRKACSGCWCPPRRSSWRCSAASARYGGRSLAPRSLSR